jgi:type VI secretion system secreted protein Hcp
MPIDSFLVFPQDPANPPISGPTPDPSAATAFPNATVLSVTGFELEVDNTVEIGSTTTGAGAGKADFGELTVTRPVDQASPLLFEACAAGRRFADVQIHLRQPAGTSESTFLAYEFQTVFITKIDWSGSTGDAVPTETLTMEFEALVVAYKPAASTASPAPVVQGSWNQVLNNNAFSSTLALA